MPGKAAVDKAIIHVSPRARQSIVFTDPRKGKSVLRPDINYLDFTMGRSRTYCVCVWKNRTPNATHVTRRGVHLYRWRDESLQDEG